MGGRSSKVKYPFQGYSPTNDAKMDGIQCYTLSDKVEYPPKTDWRSHCELCEDETNTATTSTGYITVIGEQQIQQEEMTHSGDDFDHRRKRTLLDERDYLREEIRLKEENIRRNYECCDLEMEVSMLRKKVCLIKEKEILMQDLMNTADDFKRKFGKDVEQVDDNSELFKKLVSIKLKTSIVDKINSHGETLTRMESLNEEGTGTSRNSREDPKTRRNSREPKHDYNESAYNCSADMATLLQAIESIIAREIRKSIPQGYINPAYCQYTSDGSDCPRPRPHYRRPTSDYYSYT